MRGRKRKLPENFIPAPYLSSSDDEHHQGGQQQQSPRLQPRQRLEQEPVQQVYLEELWYDDDSDDNELRLEGQDRGVLLDDVALQQGEPAQQVGGRQLLLDDNTEDENEGNIFMKMSPIIFNYSKYNKFNIW